jgi:hypothetical protein
MVQARVFDKPADIVQLAALGAYLHSTVTMCAIHNPYVRDICLSYHAYTKGRTQLPMHRHRRGGRRLGAAHVRQDVGAAMASAASAPAGGHDAGSVRVVGGDDGPAAVVHARHAPQADP